MAYERITLVGNIGSSELLKSKAGNPYYRISVAVERRVGESKTVCWYSVLLFGAMAKEQRVSLYQPGRLILVEGRPQVEAYLKKDGSAAVDNCVIATALPELLDAKR